MRRAPSAVILALGAALVACRARVRAAAHPLHPRAVTPAPVLPAPLAPPRCAAAPMRALLLSGGASPAQNGVAHERNVLFVAHTLEQLGVGADARTVLFADGDDPAPDVRVEIENPVVRRRLRALGLLLTDTEASRDALDGYRNHAALGATRAADHDTVAATLAGDAADAQAAAQRPPPCGAPSLLVYVTDHGQDVDGRSDSRIVLWGEHDLDTRELGTLLDRQPAARRVVTVMSQCYSGGFAPLVHEGGDPRRPLAAHDRCGFFAATADRTSAGCTARVDEAHYDDYTTRFFAALAGHDRAGRAVAGADLDGDGRVSPAEAHWFAVANDATTDVPVTTSEAFLRERFHASLAGLSRRPMRELLVGAPDEFARTALALRTALGASDAVSPSALRRRGDPLRRYCPPGACEAQDALDAIRPSAHAALLRAYGGPAPHGSPGALLAALGDARVDALADAAEPYLASIERLEDSAAALEQVADAEEARTERLARLLEWAALEARARRDGGATWAAYARIRACEAAPWSPR